VYPSPWVVGNYCQQHMGKLSVRRSSVCEWEVVKVSRTCNWPPPSPSLVSASNGKTFFHLGRGVSNYVSFHSIMIDDPCSLLLTFTCLTGLLLFPHTFHFFSLFFTYHVSLIIVKREKIWPAASLNKLLFAVSVFASFSNEINVCEGLLANILYLIWMLDFWHAGFKVCFATGYFTFSEVSDSTR